MNIRVNINDSMGKDCTITMYECECALIPTIFFDNEYMLSLYRGIKLAALSECSFSDGIARIEKYMSHRLQALVQVRAEGVLDRFVFNIYIAPRSVKKSKIIYDKFTEYLNNDVDFYFASEHMREYSSGILTGLCVASRDTGNGGVCHFTNIENKKRRRNRRNRNKGELHVLIASPYDKYYFYEPERR